MRLPARDTDRATPRPTVANGINFVQTLNTHRYDRNPEADCHHSDTGAERLHVSVLGAGSLGKNERAVSTFDQISGVVQSAAHAGEVLRQRIRVEQTKCEEIS